MVHENVFHRNLCMIMRQFDQKIYLPITLSKFIEFLALNSARFFFHKLFHKSVQLPSGVLVIDKNCNKRSSGTQRYADISHFRREWRSVVRTSFYSVGGDKLTMVRRDFIPKLDTEAISTDHHSTIKFLMASQLNRSAKWGAKSYITSRCVLLRVLVTNCEAELSDEMSISKRPVNVFRPLVSELPLFAVNLNSDSHHRLALLIKKLVVKLNDQLK